MANNTDKITIKVEEMEWENALDKAFKKKVKEVKVDGFRKGAVPKNIYIEKFGIESLYMDAVNTVADEAYKKALEQTKVEPIIEPSIDISKINEKEVTFEITFTGKPEVKLGDYKNLKIKKEKANVTKEEIEEELNHLRDQFAEIRVKEDGVVENGDTAVIDFKGIVDGKELEGGSGENFPLEIGSHTFIPGFEEGVLGMKVGEEKDLTLTFPEDYVKDLANKEVEFHVILHEIKTRVLPEVNEDFFKDIGYDEIKTKEDLERELEKVILDRKESEIEEKFLDDVLENASNNMEVELSEDIISHEVHHMMHQFEEQLKMQGLNLEQYYEFTHTSHDEMHENMEPEAIKRIRYRYLLEEVAKEENIELTDEEVDKDAEEMASNYGISKEELIKAFGSMEVLKYDAKMRKTLKFLKENNE